MHLFATSEALLPGVRMPPEIHDCGYDHNLLVHRVKQPIWKAACSAAPMMLSHPSPSLGVEHDAIYRPLDLIEELQT
jgi:hypothetical protein